MRKINILLVMILSMLISSCVSYSVKIPLSFGAKNEVREFVNNDGFFKRFKNEEFRFKAGWCFANKQNFNKNVLECDTVLKVSNQKCFEFNSIKHCVMLHHLSNEVYNNSKLLKRVKYFLSNLYKQKLPTKEDYDLLSQLYLFGTDGIIKKDIDKAIITMINSCNLNHKKACFNLSGIYLGIFISTIKDAKKAYFFAKKACLLNSKGGCNNLGVLYRDGGNSVKQNYKKAFQFFNKSCKLNDPDGCKEVGLFYLRGWGVSKNENKTVMLFKKACRLAKESKCEKIYSVIDYDGIRHLVKRHN